MNLKKDLLNIVNDTSIDQTNQENILNILHDTVENNEFLDETNLKLVQDILKEKVDLDNPKKELSSEEIEYAADILDKIFTYMGQVCSPEDMLLFEDIRDSSPKYLETIARN